jgi:hypothetical protein
MASNNIQQTTFWQYIRDHQIVIPIIQRDYAQGRFGKEKLREKFLKDLKTALDSENNEVLKLDFVYGSLDNNDNLYPLDGQQRLTTLWLLHWYIACKADKLSEENKSIFKNFSYETRTSSREFCFKLSEFNFGEDTETYTRIVDLIENQTWFYSEWRQDPTIQSMLNMLGGTSETDKKGNDIIDGIEELFTNIYDSKFNDYWEKLTRVDCPIVFYSLDIQGLSLTDDLYIKMNARGKALTPFENFKADLVGFLKNKTENDETYTGFDASGFDHKLDTEWTDIFWKFKSEDYKIDESYFAFFNRFFLNELITVKNKEEYFFKGEDWEKNNKPFQELIKDELNYSDYSIYTPIAKLYGDSEIEIFSSTTYIRFSKILNNFHSVFKQIDKSEICYLFIPHWDEKSNFRFIPEYKDGKITTLTQAQRVVFYAVCCYFERGEYDRESLRQWMRVVWNIVENAGINSVQSMIGTLRLIDNLALSSHGIYEHLKDRDISKDFAFEQMKEEKEKASKISKESNFEKKIIEAEKHAFFKGAIRFLFRIGENDYEWNKFYGRFEKAIEYFDENGIVEPFKKNALLLRVLISFFSKFDDFIEPIFDNNIESWRRILMSKRYMAINQFFTIENIFTSSLESFNSTIEDEKLQMFQNDLCRSALIIHFSPESYFHWRNYGKYSVFPYNTKSQAKIFVLADKRNEIFSKLVNEEIIIVDDWQKVNGLPYFKGWEINFSLKKNGKRYQWWDSLKEYTETEEWIILKDVTLENMENYLSNI